MHSPTLNRLRSTTALTKTAQYEAFNDFSLVLRNIFIEPHLASSHLHALAGIFGPDDTMERLKHTPEQIAPVRPMHQLHITDAVNAFHAFHEKMQIHWQAKDELEFREAELQSDEDQCQ